MAEFNSALPVKGLTVATGVYNNVSVSNVVTLILASNTNRRGFCIINNSLDTVYVGFNASVSVSTGIPLEKKDTISDEMYTGVVYGITATGTADIRYTEL